MKYLSRKGDDIFVADGAVKIYIMKRWVGKAPTRVIGRRVNSIGLLPMKIYKDNSFEKELETKTLMIPSAVDFVPSDIQDEKVKIYPSSDEKDYMVMYFEKGDTICPLLGPQKLDNVVLFTDLMLNGALDNNIPYKLLTPAWVSNMLSNDVSLHVPITNIDYIVSNLCRYKHDRKKRFSVVLAENPKVSQVDYVFENVRGICASTSVFSALAFEDMNYMLDAALNMVMSNREQEESPLEPIIKL
ncbi:MAG: hypothetical protein NC548_27785 [Lachnospiraceae bacterium]|nr:hypothetical protein [Lachnospiraceae bacterium]